MARRWHHIQHRPTAAAWHPLRSGQDRSGQLKSAPPWLSLPGDVTQETGMSSGDCTFFVCIEGPQGLIEPHRLGRAVQLSLRELAHAVGFDWADLSTPAEWALPVTQARLREFARIVDIVLPWCGGTAPAVMAWFRTQPLPAFGGQMAGTLVHEGRGVHVLHHLKMIANGGYA
jgi:hypothetical protein